eukprot:CAMPEP_0172813462 /NCGR_PEP_ID=MMETSP1075-20121228/10676_1 /TAXON_ID=2916 /ORGANISM="Ceratium fusus, Strain PA161109" /LENGTH=191 /DNA_ID=CAMNT_0013653165 /DNA_START=58 /DNA_END=629 /DNA_ORIENTATION=-
MASCVSHQSGQTRNDIVSSPSPPQSRLEAVGMGMVKEGNQGNLQMPDTMLDVKIDDALADALDESCVPDELLEDMNIHEAKSMSSCADDGPVLPPLVRKTALEFMATLAYELRLPKSMWFLAAALLDLYCTRRTHANTISDLRATCSALVRMLMKSDCARLNPMPSKTLDAEEAGLLRTLDWKIVIPSIES